MTEPAEMEVVEDMISVATQGLEFPQPTVAEYQKGQNPKNREDHIIHLANLMADVLNWYIGGAGEADWAMSKEVAQERLDAYRKAVR